MVAPKQLGHKDGSHRVFFFFLREVSGEFLFKGVSQDLGGSEVVRLVRFY